MKMLVVVDAHGHIIAAAHAAQDIEGPPRRSRALDPPPICGLGTLPGQRLELVELPEHLRALDAEHRLRAMLDHRLQAGSTTLDYTPRAAL
ncbi:hypothetical protein E4L96_10485 [Massilia arenosa]|uniref:Uncharacterized protein n=1 Tax=Zemynaea arenosa TaxID=2561931 RepID=A0A4Y9SCU5_9BURK|nr:hypothetical protein [Massilia arenosa]TFW20389.1 hypothetical protein E4L96_10485 [Massilia arenosa]